MNSIIILERMQLAIYFHVREKVRETFGLHKIAQYLMYHVHCRGLSSHRSAACFSLPALYPLTQASVAAFSRTSRAVFFPRCSHAVAFMLLFYGLAPTNLFSVVMADPHSCCWHENWPFYVLLFIALVVAFGWLYGIQHYACTEINNQQQYLPFIKACSHKC